MIPQLPPEQLTMAVEMVCYFFTVIGVALTLFVAHRA
jgi:hypothetical protein